MLVFFMITIILFIYFCNLGTLTTHAIRKKFKKLSTIIIYYKETNEDLDELLAPPS